MTLTRPGAPRRTYAPWLRRLSWGLAAATVLAQVAYPLLEGSALARVTVLTVLLFSAASMTHAWHVHGGAWTANFAGVVVGGSLLAEAVGVATGFPFGHYAYAGTLGPQVLGVPWLVPLAWLMFSYPAFVVARRLTRRAVAPVGGLALTTWDLFLDPQMVAAGHWTWADPTPALPGIPGVPLTNYAGWALVGVVLMATLDRTLARTERPDDTQPIVLFLWTWLGSVVGNTAFMDRASVGLVAGTAMAAVGVPLLLSLRTPGRGRR